MPMPSQLTILPGGDPNQALMLVDQKAKFILEVKFKSWFSRFQKSVVIYVDRLISKKKRQATMDSENKLDQGGYLSSLQMNMPTGQGSDSK
jgi:hypothetical protein